ncbi:hypothetical protein ACLBXJ_15595 [Methylobacterium mesophilicum]
MSGNPELWEVVSAAGRVEATRQHHAHGKISGEALKAHVSAFARTYVDREMASEISDADVADVIKRVAWWCEHKFRPPRKKGFTDSNQRLYDHLWPLGLKWAVAYRAARNGKGAVDQVALREYVEAECAAYRAVPGQAHDDDQHVYTVGKIVMTAGRMARKHEKANPARTVPAARKEARADVFFAVQHQMRVEAELAAKEGREPHDITIDEMHARLSHETVRAADGGTEQRPTGITRAGVRGAMENLRGQPRRQRLVDALPGTARDLVAVLDEMAPNKSVTVYETDSLAAKLWAVATNSATRRQQRRRLRLAGDEISGERLGLYVFVLGDVTVVARGLRLPEDVHGVVAQARADRTVRRLPEGLMPSRMGVWGTDEGRHAKALCRAVTDQYGACDLYTVVRVAGMEEGAHDVDMLKHIMDEDYYLEGLGCVVTELRNRADSGESKHPGEAREAADVLVRLHQISHEDGLCQAWYDLTGRPAYRATIAGASASASRHRVRQIGAILGNVSDPAKWAEACIASLSRPGRRAKPVPPPRPLSVQRPANEAAMPVPAERIRPAPTRVPDAALSTEVIQDIECSYRASAWKQGLALIEETFIPSVHDEANDTFTRFPPKTLDEALERLRSIIKLVRSDERLAGVRAYDEDTGGLVRQAITDAGMGLRAEGLGALVRAGQIVMAVVTARELPAARALPRTLRHLADDAAWAKAEVAAAA